MAPGNGRSNSRVFKSGNSQAVRIPRELAYDDAGQEVEVERRGDMLLIRPVYRKKLTGIAEVFAMFSPDFMADGREFHEQDERDWGGKR
jgi:antitoxin VapB